MNDMSKVIIPKSDQWNADDFLAGPMTFTVKSVSIRGGQEQPVNITLEGTEKYYRPCKSMCRVLVHCWGRDAAAYVGKSLTLYTDPKVKWGGMEVGGIRISHMSHIEGKQVMALTATKGQRKPHVVMPLVMGDKAKSQGATVDRAAQVRAEIDALPDAAAVAVWLIDNASMKTHANAQARDLYAYAETRGRELTAAMHEANLSDDTDRKSNGDENLDF